jgi:small-conductance mechanosensitive channel
VEDLAQLLLDESALWIPIVIRVAVILVVFLVLAKTIKRLLTKAAERLNFDSNLTSLLARASSITLTLFGLITALGTLGVNVSAIVAGLGLTGFALGFALKDTISNLLSGLLILLYRPFETGSHIMVSGYQGYVVAIDLRYTELDHEGKKILIPNSKLFTDPITVLK